MTESKNKKKILRYQLRVRGLFGRNRKVKSDSFTLVRECDPDKPLAVEDLLPLFRAKLAEIRFKGGIASVTEDPLTIDEYEVDGKILRTESYALFL